MTASALSVTVSAPVSRWWRQFSLPLPGWRLALLVALVALPLPWLGDRVVQWWLLVANGLLLLAFCVDVALTPSPKRFGVHRQMPPALTIGQAGTVTWEITNPTSRPVRVSVADQLAPSLGASARRATLKLPPAEKGPATATVQLRPTRRGRFTPTDIVLRVRGPLGLAWRQRSRAVPAELRVLPPFRSRQDAKLRVNRSRILEVGLRSARALGQGTDFEQLREYGPDDDSRRIDWSATARAQKPIVRTYRSERNQTCLVLLDQGRGMAARVGDLPRLEHAMDAVMALVYLATSLGDKAGLVVFSDEVGSVTAPSAGRRQLGAVTEAMFNLEPQLVESDPEAAITEVRTRFRRRAMVVLLTELDPVAAEHSLLPALPLLTKTHLVVVAAVRDPNLEEWATAVPRGPEETFRRAAAVAALADRQRLVARLRGLGVTVIDARPGTLAPQLCDAYLHAKARGGL